MAMHELPFQETPRARARLWPFLGHADFKSLIQALDANLLRRALAFGADPLLPDSTGRVALHWACDLGFGPGIEMLACPQACLALDGQNATALMICATKGNADGVRLCLPRSDPDQLDDLGWTAAMRAASFGRDAALRALVSHTRLDVVDGYGFDALMLAADEGHLDCALTLLSAGAGIQTTAVGFDALMIAAKKGHASVARALLPFCDPRRATRHGRLAEGLARHFGFEALALELEAARLAASEREQLAAEVESGPRKRAFGL